MASLPRRVLNLFRFVVLLSLLYFHLSLHLSSSNVENGKVGERGVGKGGGGRGKEGGERESQGEAKDDLKENNAHLKDGLPPLKEGPSSLKDGPPPLKEDPLPLKEDPQPLKDGPPPLKEDPSSLKEDPLPLQQSPLEEEKKKEEEEEENPSPYFKEDSLALKMYPDLLECQKKDLKPFFKQRGDYWVLENYIPAEKTFLCHESVTYTTHGDFRFLDNLGPLTDRWQGPVSVSVYTPGSDFGAAVSTILYFRECASENIKKFVTFHLFYHANHLPKEIPTTEKLLKRKVVCIIPPNFTNITTYRQASGLLYPVNVARNAARQAAQTYFIFPSDIELYPSINFIPEFFKMLNKPDKSKSSLPRVYVFSIFEVKKNVTPPATKGELQKMLKKGDAIPFHKHVCPSCHNIPAAKKWREAPVHPGLSVFEIAKRLPPYQRWEPIYVGTNDEPLYEERLSWEGKSDKMTQMFILCVRDYEFHILDNAFLVHRPGIKHHKKDSERQKIISKQNHLLRTKIWPEYKTLFGTRGKCRF